MICAIYEYSQLTYKIDNKPRAAEWAAEYELELIFYHYFRYDIIIGTDRRI